MKTIIFCTLMILASFNLVWNQVPGKTVLDSKVEQELRTTEEKWAGAHLRHDAAALEEVLADEFISIGGNGESHNKLQDIEELKSSSATYEYFTPYDLEIRVYGSVAVVIGRTRVKGHYGSGRQFTSEYRWTDVFVKRQGRWQCVAAQVVNIPPPKSQ